MLNKAIAATAVLSLGLAAFGAGTLMAQRTKSDDNPFGKPSFSECMIEQMRGQPVGMSNFAMAVCIHRTGKTASEGIDELRAAESYARANAAPSIAGTSPAPVDSPVGRNPALTDR